MFHSILFNSPFLVIIIHVFLKTKTKQGGLIPGGGGGGYSDVVWTGVRG